MRQVISLNENWKFIRQGESAEEAASKAGQTVTLPHTWNAQDGQDGGNDYYRGTCWYVKTLSLPETNGEVYLQIEGAAMEAEVYVNGEKLAAHKGGYSTFRVNITKALMKDENILAISVDNRENGYVYPQKADFTFYGGLYRNVKLIVVPEEHFDLDYYGAAGIKVTPTVDLVKHTASVTVETWQNASEVSMVVAGQTKTVPSVNGHAEATFIIENVRLWDGLQDPYLYTATAVLNSGDTVSAQFGCRVFEIDPQKGFLLNGRSYPLRGVSMHQDWKGIGNALSEEHFQRNMDIVRELGANTLRLAHYQHAQETYNLCDRLGIVVWAEIPYISMHMKNGRENTLSQMRELVVQNYNHPSIAVWGLSNEITAASAVNEDLLENHRLLHDLCRRLDNTRQAVMANVFMLETDSPILNIPEVNSYNLYYGWYVGEMSQTEEFFDAYHAAFPHKPIGFSEYGADANPQFQSPNPEKGDYTESYQALYHEHMLKVLEARPWIWASHVWNLFDFGADGRDEGGKHGENQKGLVTFNRKIKKDAFYLYKAAWSESPFVHICGKRYEDRTESVTEVKVYSNLPQVSLLVDGKPFATQSGKTVFRFQVPICSEHVIMAQAGGCSDEIRICKVSVSNPDYALSKKGDVTNWFDQEELNPNCYSVNDTLGQLRMHPETKKIVDGIMAKGAASRGDLAQSVMQNPTLMRMLERMTLIGLMKQAGEVDAESVKQLNRVLQQIQKV